jgi:hypothetical protein
MSQQIDPRGQQFAAAVTSLVLVIALLTVPGPLGIALIAVQAALFATSVGLGVQRTPVATVFRSVVRPRIGPPTHLEDAAPPRFAQGVGLVFTVTALAAFLGGADLVGFVAVALALVAALLNASIGLCLGCEVYLLLHSLRSTTPDKNQIPARQQARATQEARSTT